ncbi:MAG: hypothetical protein ACYC9L_17435 [Sulfuricaulis sp.]
MDQNTWRLPWHSVVQTAVKTHRFAAIVAHRKARKTLLAIKELDRWAQQVPGIYWHVFPKLEQARRTIWDDPDMIARNVLPEAWTNRNMADRYLRYPNGSKIYVLGANNPDSLRGPNPLGIILDEYDDMKPEMWSAIVQPIVTANKYAWCWLMGTYKGKKDLYAKHLYAREHSDEWYTIVLKASESGIIDPQALAEAKATAPQAIYDMEYECVPVEGGTSFFTRIRPNMWDGYIPDTTGKQYQIGVDLAKHMDWTVITPVELNSNARWGSIDPFIVGRPDRLNQIDWPLQKARIKAAWGLYNKGRMMIDRTGVGDPIVDDLIHDGVKPIEPITFTEETRRALLVNLQLLLAQDKVLIPDFEPLINELEAFQYEVTKSGRLTIAVPDGEHDDCVMSLALGLWKAKKIGNPFQTRQATGNPLNDALAANAQRPWYDHTDDLWKGI